LELRLPEAQRAAASGRLKRFLFEACAMFAALFVRFVDLRHMRRTTGARLFATTLH
jgi:hypothetical protein